jgi:hypothetical protein
MLGQFWFERSPCDDSVVVVMDWVDGERRGKVLTPCWISEHPLASELLLEPSDELIGLPMALSYGVLLASTAGADLTISGDYSVWPQEWGQLAEDQRHRSFACVSISH